MIASGYSPTKRRIRKHTRKFMKEKQCCRMVTHFFLEIRMILLSFVFNYPNCLLLLATFRSNFILFIVF